MYRMPLSSESNDRVMITTTDPSRGKLRTVKLNEHFFFLLLKIHLQVKATVIQK